MVDFSPFWKIPMEHWDLMFAGGRLDHFRTDEAHWRSKRHLERTESPRYAGRAVVALAGDPDVMRRTGGLFHSGELARDYGFTDADGRRIPPFPELYPEVFGED